MNSWFSVGVAVHRLACGARAALLLAGAVLASSAGAQTHRIVVLPVPADTRGITGIGINGAGAVVGFAESSSFEQYAVTWGAPPYSPLRLVGLTPETEGVARAINDAGYIVGQARTSPATFVAVMWDPSGAIVRLGELPGGQLSSEARDINAGGAVAGFGTRGTSGGFQLPRPVFWSTPEVARVLRDGPGGFSSGGAFALNDAGTVVGDGTVGGLRIQHAFRWTAAGGLQDLGDLPGGTDGSSANEVNNAEQVVGFGYSELGQRAVLWNPDGSILDLGDLTGGLNYVAAGINAAGWVVGRFTRASVGKAFVWTAAQGMRELVDLIDPADPLRAQFASANVGVAGINDAGMILGNMSVPGATTGVPFVLVPQP